MPGPGGKPLTLADLQQMALAKPAAAMDYECSQLAYRRAETDLMANIRDPIQKARYNHFEYWLNLAQAGTSVGDVTDQGIAFRPEWRY